MALMKKLIFTLLLLLPIISVLDVKAPLFASAEDATEEEVVVEETTAGSVEETEGNSQQGSTDADTTILFTRPVGDGSDLPAGKLVEFLVGFTNKGSQDFVLDTIDASFRYPMDFSFFIQNFTVVPINKIVKPKQESTVMYSFFPSEAFAGRPLGLTVYLGYHNEDGIQYQEALFNQTVTITDVSEGIDGETFFLYVFLLAFAVLFLLAGHHFLTSFGRKKTETRKAPVETGTNVKKGIDYDWIPKEHLRMAQKRKNKD